MSRVFISYSSQDRTFVDDLVHNLKDRFVDVWYDRIELKVGDSIISKINEGICESDWVILVLSQNSMKSKWVKIELDAAVTLTVKKGAFILPLLKEPVDIPPLLAAIKYADFVQNPNEGLQDILRVVAPETQFFNDEISQRTWHILCDFANEILRETATFNSRDRKERFTQSYSGLKTHWNMSDDVYNIYIDCCLKEGRLLYLTEFMKQITQIYESQSESTKDILLQFLIKKSVE